MIGAVVLASGSLLKAIAMIITGLLLGIVGADVNSGTQRFAFGIPELSDGIGVVGVAMGLFGFAEIITNLESTEKRELVTNKVKGLWISKEQFKAAWPAVLRGTGSGSVLGILPGGGAMLSSFASYTVEKRSPRIHHSSARARSRVWPDRNRPTTRARRRRSSHC